MPEANDALSLAQRNAVTELLRIAPVVDRLGDLFVAAGFELYLVGGSVRDALRGELGHDLDFTTSARPDDIEALLRQFTRGRTWGPRCGTSARSTAPSGARVPLSWPGSAAEPGPVGDPGDSAADWAYWLIEITTFRSDVYRSDSRKPEVAFGDTIEGDLVRRDFTVNAMAIRLPDREFVDPPITAWPTCPRGSCVRRAPPRAVLLRRSVADDAGGPVHLAAERPPGSGSPPHPRGGRGDAGDGPADRDHLRRAGPRRAVQAGAHRSAPGRD